MMEIAGFIFIVAVLINIDNYLESKRKYGENYE